MRCRSSFNPLETQKVVFFIAEGSEALRGHEWVDLAPGLWLCPLGYLNGQPFLSPVWPPLPVDTSFDICSPEKKYPKGEPLSSKALHLFHRRSHTSILPSKSFIVRHPPNSMEPGCCLFSSQLNAQMWPTVIVDIHALLILFLF